MKHKSQMQRILARLEKGKSITPLEALEKFGCFRLSARIGQLRDMGYHIITDPIRKDGKSFASYSLIQH